MTLIEGESWKDVPGFIGYQVSDYGRCRRITLSGRYKELRGKLDRLGYQHYGLVRKVRQEWFLAHRLIAAVFLSPVAVQDGQFMTVNHKNRIRNDNRLVNLELMTVTDNHRHWRKHHLSTLTDNKNP